ncbi:hypothetical protein pb186bvf_000638 [Paramecium bursaria]
MLINVCMITLIKRILSITYQAGKGLNQIFINQNEQIKIQIRTSREQSQEKLKLAQGSFEQLQIIFKLTEQNLEFVQIV